MAAYTLDSRTFMCGQQLLSAQRQHKPTFGLTTIAQAGRSIRDPNAPPKESRIGKRVVSIPSGVEVKVDGQHVSVKVGSLIGSVLRRCCVFDGVAELISRLDVRGMHEFDHPHHTHRVLLAALHAPSPT